MSTSATWIFACPFIAVPTYTFPPYTLTTSTPFWVLYSPLVTALAIWSVHVGHLIDSLKNPNLSYPTTGFQVFPPSTDLIKHESPAVTSPPA